MQNKEDKSFGVIPVFNNEKDEFLFCLVREEDGHWGFPKGHQEDGEFEEEAARRELEEETGIKVGNFLNEKVFIEKYSFERDGFHYDKSVKYFLMVVPSMGAATPDNFKKEIPELRWLGYEEAKQLLTFPEAKDVLNQTYRSLNTKDN